MTARIILDTGPLVASLNHRDAYHRWVSEEYADVPMSLADACLVRMAELHDNAVIFTLDRDDFTIYRKHGDKLIPSLMPGE